MRADSAPGRRPGRPPPAARPLDPGLLVVGRGTLAAGAALFVALTAWAGAATWYILCRDEVTARFLAHQTRMQYSYEDRIALLRARLDRLASQKLIEQDGIEARIGDLVSRQVQLETRQAALSALADLRSGASGAARAPSPPQAEPAEAARPLPAKPSPADGLGLRLRDAGPVLPGSGPRALLDRSDLPAEERVAALGRSVDAVEAAQLRTLQTLIAQSRHEVAQLRGAVAEAGLEPEGPEATPAVGIGGPLVPLATGAFGQAFQEAQTSLVQLRRLRRQARSLPFGRPAGRDAEMSSGYGVRLDPFTRGAAMHTGVDFRAEHGTPARAAGAGRVIAAEPAGGYGNMVEIEHEGGVTTRYAHLSAFTVSVGQVVAAGAVVGRVGSTGRSTGPHLHYEVRINGEPVNPQRFLRAGARLAALQTSIQLAQGSEGP